MERLICVIIGYLFGLLQTGYLYGKLHGVDIREYGSGNAGTTNALRVLGKKAGIITYLGDAFKAVFAGLVVELIFKESHPDMIRLLVLYSGMGVVLGHNYPFYLHFKGGKGIAAISGMALAFDWKLALCMMVVFIVIVAVTRYVSLGSILMMLFFFGCLVVKGQMGYYPMGQAYLYEVYLVGGILTILTIEKHRANIGRLLKGTENKLGGKKGEGTK